jgi:hypothetical protein
VLIESPTQDAEAIGKGDLGVEGSPAAIRIPLNFQDDLTISWEGRVSPLQEMGISRLRNSFFFA